MARKIEREDATSTAWESTIERRADPKTITPTKTRDIEQQKGGRTLEETWEALH